MKKKKKKRSTRGSIWDVKKDAEGVIWIRENAKCRIWTERMSEAEEFLAIWVDPDDIMRFKGFKDKEMEFKGIKFLKEYYGSVEAIPRDRKR
jgi:hypothetical protein